jgi:hypothetical protein
LSYNSKDGSNILPPFATNLQSKIDRIGSLKTNNTNDFIIKIATIYLMLFDTISLVTKLTTPEEKMKLLNNKQLMGLLLNRRSNQSGRIKNFILSEIQKMENANP